MHVGKTIPRLWTRPLRDLTPETSLGFEVIEFARQVLRVELRAWQQWLLIHALELLEDGSYRFRRVVVLVARQNGKTMLASVLAAWWLFVDSTRRPDMVPPLKFKIVGTAQNLDIAREPWSQVKLWANPDPDSDDAVFAISDLQAATSRVRDTNGDLGIFARNRAHYEVRAAKNARGKPAARVLMDELREQQNWLAWNAVSQTTKSFWSGQLWAISNAGDAKAVVLKAQRDAGLKAIAEWDQYVGAGVMAAEEFANDHDVSIGLFEWSAPDGCAPDDVDGILQANPSIGSPGCAVTVKSCLSDAATMPDAGYRTEVLCQWVTAQVDSYIDVREWRDLQVQPADVVIPRGGRTVWGFDVSSDRRTGWLAAATLTDDGRPFATVRTRRAGDAWIVKALQELASQSGFDEVVIQSRGCPAMQWVDPLREAGLTVHALEGGQFALATGRMHDHVRDGDLVIVAQPDVDLAVEGGVVTRYAENLAWSRTRSEPVDIAGLVAMTEALYGLEVLQREEPVVVPPPPPAAGVLHRDDGAAGSVNLANVSF